MVTTTINLLGDGGRFNGTEGNVMFSRMTFPDGQPHIKLHNQLLHNTTEVRVIARVTNPTELLEVVMVREILRKQSFVPVTLDLMYLMGGRMDRAIDSYQPFTLKTVTDIIKGAGYDHIRLYEPHSDVSLGMLDAEKIPATTFMGQALADRFLVPMRTWFAVPDAGASKRVETYSREFGIPSFQCLKTRDVQTGELSGFEIATTEDLDGAHVMIPDDICDGGGTFIGLAAKLRARGVTRIALAVPHGVFSKGYWLDGIDIIYTTNSYQNHDLPFSMIGHVKVFDCVTGKEIR